MRKLIIKNLNPAAPIWQLPTIEQGSDTKSIKALQLALWDAGYYKGVTKNGKQVTYKQTVDGKMGPITQQAMANYEKSLQPETLGWLPLEKQDEIKAKAQAYDDAKEAGRKRAERLNFTIDLGKEPRRPSRVERVMGTVSAPGYPAPANLEILTKAGEEAYMPAFFTPLFNNMYQYSYGDMLVRDGKATPYFGEELKEGDRLRQVTGKEGAVDLGLAAVGKVWASLWGKDPRRKILNEMAELDLTTPEGREAWNKLLPEARKAGVIRVSGSPENAQWEMRARLENAHRFNTGKSKYDIYEENPDYTSPTAEAAGAPTYRIKDPKQRERINGLMYNFYKKQAARNGFGDYTKMSEEEIARLPHYKVNEQNDTTYFVPNMGYLGNTVIVADSPTGANMRNMEKWDYIPIANAGGHDFYVGDRLADENGRPLYHASGTGRNSPGFTESFFGLTKLAIPEWMEYFKGQMRNVVK